MEETEIFTPERIFHYTSINSLALMLHHRTLRFTKLSKLNDPLEGRAGDLDRAARLIFCSSWTSKKEDTIPMWKMYSELAGVRIAVSPSRMFEDVGEIKRGSFKPKTTYCAEFTSELTFPTKGYTRLHSQRSSIRYIFGPDPVHYDEPHRAFPARITGTAAGIREGKRVEDPIAYLSTVGLSKPKHWEFENEVRFRLMANPIINCGNIQLKEFCDIMEIDRDHIDVSLSDDFFSNASVLLGPLCEPAHKILIESLIEKYAPSVDISKSDIQIR
ncbi:hypothetical protein [Candidatus Halocynthiibacter alkanivorans]|uniref:hypothetical protein n=1 Tax=Candidatus Halocynthiibacter alkanivorans TaxID=2267619 RepID=UPI000DF1EF95|nr:hypothetical protein [Candidatus Halocynthiibacter alkanivorans]